MTLIWRFLPLVLACAAANASAESLSALDQRQVSEQTVTEHTIGFAVGYSKGQVQFGALLPAGWQFSIRIDGNQDAKWGIGEGPPSKSVDKTDDRQFALTADGHFCPQYIIAAYPGIPERVLVASICGKLPSRGRVKIEGVDQQRRTIITLSIPEEEVFGVNDNAHLQICIWDTKIWSCVYSPQEPLVVVKNAGSEPAVT